MQFNTWRCKQTLLSLQENSVDIVEYIGTWINTSDHKQNPCCTGANLTVKSENLSEKSHHDYMWITTDESRSHHNFIKALIHSIP